jgi:hypothetical protein
VGWARVGGMATHVTHMTYADPPDLRGRRVAMHRID